MKSCKIVSCFVLLFILITDWNCFAQDTTYLKQGIKPQFTESHLANTNYSSSVSNKVVSQPIINSHKIYGLDTINRTDAQGKKQGHWIFFGKDRPESGIPAEGKVEEGDYLDDRKTGLWTRYHDDGKTPKLQGFYENNRPKGRYIKFWKSGLKREIGNFTKNLSLDSVKRWFENGQLEYEAWFNENGKEHGRVNYFYPSGQLEITYTAVDGVASEFQHFDREGKQIPQHPISHCNPIKEPIVYDDKLKTSEDFVYTKGGETMNTTSPIKNQTPIELPIVSATPDTRGVPFNKEGYNKVYNEDGEIYVDGKFKNGQLYDGKHYVYDRDGILLNVRIFKGGIYHSDGQL